MEEAEPGTRDFLEKEKADYDRLDEAVGDEDMDDAGGEDLEQED